MRSTQVCKHCNEVFDLHSPEKRRAGGFINECPDCVEEHGTGDGPKLVGVSSGDGKMATVTILRFESKDNADAYMSAWRASTGMNRGKSCQMGNTKMLSMDKMGGTKITEFGGNPNHKGKS